MREDSPDRPVHYLESFDSVRSAWGHPGQSEACALAQLEAVVALAFGRDLVVQQSQAIDSLAAQTVIADVASAHKRVSVEDKVDLPRPIRLHLFRSRTFAEAAVAGLGAIRPYDQSPGAEERQFHSSLYPQLHEADPAHLARAIDELGIANEKTMAALIGGRRGELFEKTWDWFHLAQAGDPEWVVTAKPRTSNPGLALRLNQLIDAATRPDHDPVFDDHDVHSAIEALVTLRGSGGPDALANRSQLHGSWQWHDTGRTPTDIVGPDRIGAVRTIVDTLYNRVVVDSIGVASASYTTAIGDQTPSIAASIAQAVALHASDHDEPDSAIAPLEVNLNPQAAEGHPMLDPKNAIEIFYRLLAARTDPGWNARLDRLADATISGGERAELVEQHLDAVARVLDGFGGAAPTDDGRLNLWLTQGVGLAGVALQAVPPALSIVAPLPVVGALMVGGAISLSAPTPLSNFLRSRRERKAVSHVRSSFGELIAAPGVQ